MVAINYLAVLLAALANFIIGAVFHMPPVGKLWMKLANVKPPKDGKMPPMAGPMIKNYIVNVVFAYGLAVIISLASTSTLTTSAGLSVGICMAVIVWFTFLVTSSSINVIWLGQSAKLWLYEAGVSLLSCIAMGAIIASL